MARRRARIGRGDQFYFCIGDRPKAVTFLEDAMMGEDRNLRQDADAKADRDGSLNTSDVGARIGQVPRAAGGYIDLKNSDIASQARRSAVSSINFLKRGMNGPSLTVIEKHCL